MGADEAFDAELAPESILLSLYCVPTTYQVAMIALTRCCGRRCATRSLDFQPTTTITKRPISRRVAPTSKPTLLSARMQTRLFFEIHGPAPTTGQFRAHSILATHPTPANGASNLAKMARSVRIDNFIADHPL